MLKLFTRQKYTMPFRFIDLFAGIGGTRLAFERAGGTCVFSSEIDRFARKTYFENFGEIPSGDITKLKENEIPDHQILVAGVPCSPFSIAGVSKRQSLDRAHGFDCRKKGQLFFKVTKILEIKKPEAFFLENVKHLKFHNQGKTFRTILKHLKRAGYNVWADIVDARFFVPQHRERVYIIGFRKDLESQFAFPEFTDTKPEVMAILEKDPDPKYTLSDKLWRYLQTYKKKHRSEGNGFGYTLVDTRGISRTLTARYYKDGAEILVEQQKKNPRRLTPSECKRLMGFPDLFKLPVSDTQAYKQLGNSVVIPLVEKIAGEIAACLHLN